MLMNLIFKTPHQAALPSMMMMTFSQRAEGGKAAVLTRLMTSTHRRLKLRMIYDVKQEQSEV